MSSAAPIAAVKPAARAGHGRMHLLMLLVIVCWASNIIAGKQALTCLGATALAQARMLGAAVMFAVLFVAGRRASRRPCPQRQPLLLLALAALCMALNQLWFIGGMARSTVAHTGFIVALGPLMVLIIAVAIRQESLTAWKLTGMLIAFTGVAILTADQAGRGAGRLWGDLLLLGSTIVFAAYTVVIREVANQFDTVTLNTLIFVLGTFMMMPFFARDVWATHWRALTFEAWWGLIFMVVVGTVMSYLVFGYVMTELAASRAAAFNYLQPVIASGLGAWVLSERLTSKVLMGGSLILAGVYLTERERGEEKA